MDSLHPQQRILITEGTIMKKASRRVAAVFALAMSAIAAQATGLDAADQGSAPQARAAAPLTRAQVIADLKATYGNGEVPSMEVLYRFPGLEQGPARAAQPAAAAAQETAAASGQAEPPAPATR